LAAIRSPPLVTGFVFVVNCDAQRVIRPRGCVGHHGVLMGRQDALPLCGEVTNQSVPQCLFERLRFSATSLLRSTRQGHLAEWRLLKTAV
jgi:hypothetical protein